MLTAREEGGSAGFSDVERDAWRRLATHPGMEAVFQSADLQDALDEDGWRLLVNQACSGFAHQGDWQASKIRAEAERHPLESIEQLMEQLCEELADYQALHGAGGFAFATAIQAVLTTLATMPTEEKDGLRFATANAMFRADLERTNAVDEGRYLPSILEVLQVELAQLAAHNEAARDGAAKTGVMLIDASLSRRSTHPIPTWVRFIDRSLDFLKQLDGQSFRVPAAALQKMALVLWHPDWDASIGPVPVQIATIQKARGVNLPAGNQLGS